MQVDDLVSDTIKTNVRVHNTFNEFLMLSNFQFVENRVYDDDVKVPAQEPSQDEAAKTQDMESMTKEQREQIQLPKYTEALRCEGGARA
jgi:WASH complex subunit FAM21